MPPTPIPRNALRYAKQTRSKNTTLMHIPRPDICLCGYYYRRIAGYDIASLVMWFLSNALARSSSVNILCPLVLVMKPTMC